MLLQQRHSVEMCGSRTSFSGHVNHGGHIRSNKHSSAILVRNKTILGATGLVQGSKKYTVQGTSSSRGQRSVWRISAQNPEDGDPSSSSKAAQENLPIFPLGIVALPASQCPLHIFEARYRVLFSTLLDGDEGVDAGLVSPDKPWRGTRRFGMAYYDQQAGGLASIGTVLEIEAHSTMEDGRMLIENVGKQRFKIVDVVEEKPVLVCRVEYLDDEEDIGDDVTALGREVADLFKDVVKLSTKIKDADVDEDVLEPKELQTLGPRDLSFWVASLFAGSPYNQQALLEENSTQKRLEIEKELLENTLKYLSAQSALQSAFTDTNESDS
ncbi:hypothetical protein M9434_004544 [Picochlorum sp. BPE23]|nr:hypothetical protein M9434_004544 [Picochlorum sp. BPE23]